MMTLQETPCSGQVSLRRQVYWLVVISQSSPVDRQVVCKCSLFDVCAALARVQHLLCKLVASAASLMVYGIDEQTHKDIEKTTCR